jgi:hypothetical protein
MGSQGNERAFEEIQPFVSKARRASGAWIARKAASEAFGKQITQFADQLETFHPP